VLDDDALTNEAVAIVEKARSEGIVLRILGAVAVRLHSEGYSSTHRELDRLGQTGVSFTDLDLIGYSSQKGRIRKLMEELLGFTISRQFLLLYGSERLLYRHAAGLYTIDIFLDKLTFSHDIFFGNSPNGGRLELDYPTIPLSDLLLEKLQIHEINEKDIKDLVVLLLAHEHGLGNREAFDIDYLPAVLGNDWGFWQDAKTNLKKVLACASTYHAMGLLSYQFLQEIQRKAGVLMNSLENCPKTENWKKRAKAGVTKKFWRDVEEVYR